MSGDAPSTTKTDGDGTNLLSGLETEEHPEQKTSRWLYDHSYDDTGMPTGVSILLSMMGSVALLVAAAYLRASFRHEREIKLSAYEQAVAEWKKFRFTFARLHINVTAHFGVPPANTSDPGLDPNPPHQGGRIMLTRSTDPDPIWDEEGPGGGLPNYRPLKFSLGTAPEPWRTAPRYSQEDEENGSDDSNAEATGSEGSQDSDGGKKGDDDERLRERSRYRRRVEEKQQKKDNDADVFRGRSESRGLWWGEKKAKDNEEENQGGTESVLPERFIPSSAFDDAPFVRFVFTARLDPSTVKGARRRKRKKSNNVEDRAEPTGEGNNESGTQPLEGGGNGRGRELGWRQWNQMKARNAGEKEDSLFAKLETEWTPLTRIREEHAPMPAPDTKCMQVFGGVHNYKTKMCEVYERLSQVCVQVRFQPMMLSLYMGFDIIRTANAVGMTPPVDPVAIPPPNAYHHKGYDRVGKNPKHLTMTTMTVKVHIDEDKGIIAFAPVVEDENTGGGGDGMGDGKAGSDDGKGEDDQEKQEEDGGGVPMAPRYGCDPRTAWSPWRYAVLQVEGRTATDVIPPPSVSFVETLITSRSELDPFLRAEKLTYTPPNGGGTGGGDAGGGEVVMESGGDGTGGGGGGQFLTFGLSSWSSAVVGCTFLVVGLLLLVQPMLALMRWRRRAVEAASGGGETRFSRGGRGNGDMEGGALGRGKRPRGQWSYGQVDTQWEEESEFSEESSYAQGEVDWARGVQGHRQSPTGIGMRQSSLNGAKSSGDQVGHSGGLSTDFLRRRAGDGSDSAADEEGGIQLGVMAKGNGAGGERTRQGVM